MRGLEHAQRKRGEGEHLLSPVHGLALEIGERDDGVDQPPVVGLLRAVLPAEHPDLARALHPDRARQQARAVATVEGADLGSGLPEARIGRGNRQIADDVQHVATADGVASDHGDYRLGRATDLDLKVEDIEPPDALLGDVIVPDVAVVAADHLVAAAAEGPVTLAGEDDDADAVVIARLIEGVGDLEERLGPEGIALVRAIDGDLGDAGGIARRVLVTDIAVVPDAHPLARGDDARVARVSEGGGSLGYDGRQGISVAGIELLRHR